MRLSASVNQSFTACNGVCTPTCEPGVNTSGAAWVTIQVAAAVQVSTSNVVESATMTQLIADAVGATLGVRSEAIDVALTALSVEIRSAIVVWIDGSLNRTKFSAGLASAFEVLPSQFTLEDTRRREMQASNLTRHAISFAVELEGNCSSSCVGPQAAPQIVTELQYASPLGFLDSLLAPLGHDPIVSLTVTAPPTVTTLFEYVVRAVGVPNSGDREGTEQALLSALGGGEAGGNESALLSALILNSTDISDAIVLALGVTDISTDIATAANDLLSITAPLAGGTGHANATGTNDTTLDEWEEADVDEPPVVGSAMIVVYIVGASAAVVVAWVYFFSKIWSLVRAHRKSKVSVYDVEDSDEGHTSGDDEEEEDERPETSSTIVARRDEIGHESFMLKRTRKKRQSGFAPVSEESLGATTTSLGQYSYYTDDDAERPLSRAALDEIEALNEIAKARRQLCTPVTPVRPRIANATEIQDKLQARRNEKDSRAQQIADIDARLRSHVSDRGKGAAGLRRDLLRQKEQLRKEQAMHSQDFDGEDGKKKRAVNSRAVKAVWSSERKEFQSVLKDRRPKSRLNELKDRALRRKIQLSQKAAKPGDSCHRR